MPKDDEQKTPNITDILNLRIFGIDFGQMLKNWLGAADLTALQDPTYIEEVKKKIEQQREKLKEAQEELRKKFGDAVRFDYDIRVRSLLGEEGEVRIGGGQFFERLDDLARERALWKKRIQSFRRPVRYVKKEGVIEPITEVIAEKGHLQVIAEIPGVDENSIELKVEEDKVTITTESSERKYRAEIPLPEKVLTEPVERTYNNGILRVRLKLQTGNA